MTAKHPDMQGFSMAEAAKLTGVLALTRYVSTWEELSEQPLPRRADGEPILSAWLVSLFAHARTRQLAHVDETLKDSLRRVCGLQEVATRTQLHRFS